jgi:hypothetical protein
VRRPKKSIHFGKGGGAGAALICLFGAADAARAQSVLMPPPPTYSATPPAVQAMRDEGAGSLPAELQNPPLPAFSDLLHWGPVTLRPHFNYQITYGDGLQSAPGQPQTSVVQTFSPGVLVNIGTHCSLDYTPSLYFYSNPQFKDTLDQNVSLIWGTSFEDWTFGFTQGFSAADDPLVQTGTQTSTRAYNTSLSASYRMNSVMSIDTSLNQSVTDADQFTSSKLWSTMEWLNYQFFPRLDGAIGAGFGYDSVSAGTDMTHETLQVRLNCRVGNKLSLSAHGGAEDRQYLGGGVPDTISPIYGVALQYQATHTTFVSLSADRSITPSLFLNQASDSTVLSMNVNQSLMKHFNLNVSSSYNTTRYLASAARVVAGRTDDYYSISARLSWVFLKRASASLSYQYNTDQSSAPGLNFSSSQYGAQLGYAF